MTDCCGSGCASVMVQITEPTRPVLLSCAIISYTPGADAVISAPFIVMFESPHENVQSTVTNTGDSPVSGLS